MSVWKVLLFTYSDCIVLVQADTADAGDHKGDEGGNLVGEVSPKIWVLGSVVTISLDNDVLAGDSRAPGAGARGAAVVCGDNGPVIRPRSIVRKWAG